jgi:uncharacterized protein YdaU (DUF1376 family)
VNFYKRHLGDYSKDTPHLSMIEHGAYGLLLDYCYATERGLPGDFVSIFRICRAITKAEQQAVRSVVEQFFAVGQDGLRYNKRCNQELEKANRQREVNRVVGQLGGRPKKTETKTESVSETGAEHKTESVSKREPNGNPSQTPDSRQHLTPPLTPLADAKGESATANGHDLLGDIKPKRTRRRKPVTDCPDEFDISDAMYDWANAKGISDDEVVFETERCLNHHKAKGNMHADWSATWRTWMLNVVRFRRERLAS